MEFFFLGPIEARKRDQPLPLAPRQKVLLALLALNVGDVVPRDRLIDELWRGSPPETAENALHGVISQLRKLLEQGEAAVPIATRAPGYALEVDPESIDLYRFERLLELGRRAMADDEPSKAREHLGAALELWRGPPLADVADAPFAQVEAPRLEELRLQALEERIEADLRLGRRDELVPELQKLVGHNPYRERLRRQLMLALYRSGRQADALAVYSDGRRVLVEDLGLDPGPELQELERAILRQDPALDVPTPRAARPRRMALLGAIVGLGVAAAGGASFLAFGRDSDDTPVPAARPNSLAVIEPSSNRLVDYIPVGEAPIAVAVGEGAVWVVNAQDGTLSRIDPTTRKVVRTIGLGTPATDVALGFGSVWVANGSEGSLTRVDPRSNAVVQTIRVAPELPLVSPATAAVIAGHGSVWLTAGTRRVLRLDPVTGRIEAAVRVQGAPISLALGDTAVWAGTFDGRVVRIEEATNATTAAVAVEDSAFEVAVGEGAVWAAVCCDSVWRIDPETGVLTSTIPVGAVSPSVAVGARAVWAASVVDGTVSRIDPDTGRVVKTIRVGGAAVDVAVGEGAVWVAVQRPVS